MTLEIKRYKFDEHHTESCATLPDGTEISFIERPEDSKNPCIKAGEYFFERDLTGNHRWWKILDVEGRTNIEMHPANYAHQLLGCIAPCIKIVDGAGWHSVDACNKLMEFYGEVGVKYHLRIVEVD
jgi:hypothetical protein